jgi:hypothetical protein
VKEALPSTCSAKKVRWKFKPVYNSLRCTANA